MKASVFFLVALLALACVASAQPAKRNTTMLDEPAAAAPRMNRTGAAGKNATTPKAGAAAGAGAKPAAGAATGPEPVEPKGAAAASSPSPAAGAKDVPAPSPSPAPKKSGAAIATTGFAAAVAGSVVLLQLVL